MSAPLSRLQYLAKKWPEVRWNPLIGGKRWTIIIIWRPWRRK